jgi:signal transduction histidine kinase
MTNSGQIGSRGRHSVFRQILRTLLWMAVLILLVVGTFLKFFYGSQIGPSVGRLIRNHVELLAREMGDPPDPDKALALARAQGFEVRFESPELRWTTSDSLPAIAQARDTSSTGNNVHLSGWNRYFVVAGPRGGKFLFSWDFGWATAIHNELFAAVLILILLLIFGAHFSIRHYLKPIKSLRLGVDRLGSGDFEIQVPVRGGDELASLAEAFNAMTRRLGGMVKARDQLLTDVSHELRSPLTRMKLALEFIPSGEKKSRLEADLREMETMVSELLEIERLKNSHGKIRLESASLAEFLEETVGAFAGRRPGIRVLKAERELRVLMDSERMKTAMRNILENALKYSPPDGPPVEIEVGENESSVLIRIKDEGQGIPESDIPRIFDPFYRVDRSRSKASGGYGLGLAMCRRILEAHSGTIAIQNNRERGVTVVLALPKMG